MHAHSTSTAPLQRPLAIRCKPVTVDTTTDALHIGAATAAQAVACYNCHPLLLHTSTQPSTTTVLAASE
eukprot:9841-Heterococcus_DN1.PRE.2